MRCPFLATSTHSDVWIDPWAAWVLHVLSTYRKLTRINPVLCRKIFSQAKAYQAIPNDTMNGAPVVLARLLKDLGWTWTDDLFVWSRRSDTNFYLHSGSQTFFQEELERSVRQRLFAQSPIRHDNLGDAKDRHINIELTRFLADGDFASSDVSDVLAQHISQIPTSIQHAKRILPFLFTGSLFDGPRKQRAGLVDSTQCPLCQNDDETLVHMFNECPVLDLPVVPEHVPQTSWTTGIIFESEEDLQKRRSRSSDFQRYELPGPFELTSNCDIFIDGSCFYSRSKRFKSAAVGIYSPERVVFQYPVAGPDHSPQRAELSALAVSLRIFNGEIHIYSDCATVVRGFNILKSSGFCLDLLNKWDNYDLWSEICQSLLVRNGPVLVFKVAAHGRDASQSQYLTDGNAKADRAAKTLAAEHFGNNFCDLTPSLRWVFDLQVHIVQIFVARSNDAVLRDLGFVDVSQVGGQNVNTSIDTRLLCTCVPHRRFAKKTQVVCLGKCPAALQTCTLERAFLHLLSQRLHVPVNIWKGLEARYPTFHAWLESRATLCAPSNMDTVEIPRKRKISDVAKSYILDSINQSYWTDTADWTPWAFFMIDTISSQGFLDGVLSSEQSFGLLITRFRSVWIHFLLHAFPQITENKAAKHGSAFGLLKLSAFHLHLRPRNKVALWSVLIQASLDCNFESTQKRRSRSHWKPNWQLVWKEILAAYACRCLQGTRDCGKETIVTKMREKMHLVFLELLSSSILVEAILWQTSVGSSELEFQESLPDGSMGRSTILPM